MTITAILLASIKLISPAQDATVALVPDCQKTVMTNETLEARAAVFAADRKSGKTLKHAKLWRKPNPVVFRWETTDGEGGPWELQISKSSDFSAAQTFLFKEVKNDDASGRGESVKGGKTFSFEEPTLNLEIATRYYWKVTSNITCGKFAHSRICDCKDKRPPTVSETGSFSTEDLAPRWIVTQGHVGNFRDLGGRRTSDGRRVKQGMIYRSRGLNDNSVDGVVKGRNRLTAYDIENLTETLGIRTDLDLRTDCEVAGMNGISPLGASVKFIHSPSAAYDGCFKKSGMEPMARNFRVFCDEANYPVLFHCIGGADRTGALAYVLNGVLGVSKHELETDWESTFYPNIPGSDEVEGGKHVWNSEWHFKECLRKYGNENSSLKERIELYLLDCGVTREEIEKFRSIMLEKSI